MRSDLFRFATADIAAQLGRSTTTLAQPARIQMCTFIAKREGVHLRLAIPIGSSCSYTQLSMEARATASPTRMRRSTEWEVDRKDLAAAERFGWSELRPTQRNPLIT